MSKENNNEYKIFAEVLERNQDLLKGKPIFKAKFIPDYLKRLRLSKDISLRKVAEKTGLSDTYISLIESGKRPLPRLETLEKICDAYGINLLELITMDEIGKTLILLHEINEKFPIDVKKLVENYSKLNAENKRVLNMFLAFLLQQNLTEQPDPYEGSEYY